MSTKCQVYKIKNYFSSKKEVLLIENVTKYLKRSEIERKSLTNNSFWEVEDFLLLLVCLEAHLFHLNLTMIHIPLKNDTIASRHLPTILMHFPYPCTGFKMKSPHWSVVLAIRIPIFWKPTWDTDKLNSKLTVRFEEFSFIETIIFSKYLH